MNFSTFSTNAILQMSAFYYYIQRMPKWKMNVNMPNEMQIHLNHFHMIVALSRETECGFNAFSIDSLVHSLSITYGKSLLIVLIEFYASKTTIINSWLYGISEDWKTSIILRGCEIGEGR